MKNEQKRKFGYGFKREDKWRSGLLAVGISMIGFGWFFSRHDAEIAIKRTELKQYQQIFLKYSRVGDNGALVMTVSDFLLAMSHLDNSLSSDDLKVFYTCFGLADSNNDGLLSFTEFLLFVSLLSTPDAPKRITFQLFDLDQDGLISKEDFKKVLNMYVVDTAYNNDAIDSFFEDGQRKLSYEEFSDLLKSIRQRIADREFEEFDTNNSGYIHHSDFSNLISDHIESVNVPDSVKDSVREICIGEEYISRDMYHAIHRVIREIESVELCVEICTTAGYQVNKKEFTRLSKVITGLQFTQEEIDVIFRIYDRNFNGSLDRESHQWILGSRANETVIEGRKKLSVLSSVLIGGASVKFATFLTYPLDRVKTYLQISQGYSVSVNKVSTIAKTILIKEGWSGFYRGLRAQLSSATPTKIAKLTLSDYFRRKFNSDRTSYFKEGLAGGLTGAVIAIPLNPFEIVKLKIQTNPLFKRMGPIKQLSYLKFSSWWRGLGATILKETTFHAIFFSAFAWMKNKLRNEESGVLLPYRLLLSSSVSSVFAVMLSNPFDVIKTRLQTDKTHRYLGFSDCVKQTIRKEGYLALWRGAITRAFIIVPLFTIAFTMFDSLQSYFAPNTVLPLRTWQEELDTVHTRRLAKVGKLLEKEFGIDINNLKDQNESNGPD